jgi:hypothetical protein
LPARGLKYEPNRNFEFIGGKETQKAQNLKRLNDKTFWDSFDSTQK